MCGDAAGTADDGLGHSLSQNLLAAHYFGDRGASFCYQDLPAADGHLLHRRLESRANRDAHHLESSRKLVMALLVNFTEEHCICVSVL